MRLTISTFILLMFVTSCGKSPSELRFKEYPVEAVNTLGITASLYFFEINNGTTLVRSTLYGTVPGKAYGSHIHEGNINNYNGNIINLGDIYDPTANSAVHEFTVDKTYDEMIAYNGCFIVHNPDTTPQVILRANIGSNAP